VTIRYALACSLVAVASLSSAQTYSVRYMNMSQSQAAIPGMSLNDLGDVTGSFFFPSVGFRAFRWTGGSPQNLGSLNGQASHGTAINNAGLVVGYSDQNGAAFTTRGFTFAGSMVEVPPLDGRDTYVNAVNSSGLYVGSATKTVGSSQLLLPAWLSGGQFVRLPVLPGSQIPGDALGVNDAGVVIGNSGASDGTGHAVRWVNGQIQDLGLMPGRTNANARDIDSAGRILVQQSGGGGSFATLWANGSYTQLGSFGASRMNDAGQIIGGMTINGVQQSILRQANGEIIELEQFLIPEGLSFFQAMDINNAGQIVGTAVRSSSGLTEFVILNPVPEPGTLAVVGLGALALLRKRRRK
jgi:probable HAF family extracellular repeat protein